MKQLELLPLPEEAQGNQCSKASVLIAEEEIVE